MERLSSFEKATLGDSRFKLLKINVGIIRHYINDGLDVAHNPVAENEAHCLITGHITAGKQKQLLRSSEEVFRPVLKQEKREDKGQEGGKEDGGLI